MNANTYTFELLIPQSNEQFTDENGVSVHVELASHTILAQLKTDVFPTRFATATTDNAQYVSAYAGATIIEIGLDN